MAINKLSGKKSTPVPVSTPVQDCAQWCDLKLFVKEAEKKLESLKKRIGALVPLNQTAERIPATRNGMNGEYVITHISQERGSFDDDKLMELIRTKGLKEKAMTIPRPDHQKIVDLVKAGIITEEEIATCFTSKPVQYYTCTFEEK